MLVHRIVMIVDLIDAGTLATNRHNVSADSDFK